MMAVSFACQFEKYITLENIGLYERLIREGAWWDVCDNITPNIVGKLLEKSPEKTWAILDKWNSDEHLWLRRASILSQESRGEETDGGKLFEYC